MTALLLFYDIIKSNKIGDESMDQSKKQRIRQEMKDLRNGLDVFTIEALSNDIFKRFLELDLSNYNSFFVYNSFGSEVQTQNIIKHLLQNNKKVYLPRVAGSTMHSIQITEDTEFEKSKYGIIEPVGEPAEVDNIVAIMPCLAVDKQGNRIGYGKGYYDKFLQNKNALKIVICYDFQIIEEIKPDAFDIPADVVVSDKKTLFVMSEKEKTI